VPAEVEKYITG